MLVDARLSSIGSSLRRTPLVLWSAMLPDRLLGHEGLTESVDVLLILALLVQVACRRERRAVLIQSNQAIRSRRSC